MTLKPAEFDKLKAHVDKTWTSSRCPMCDANDWGVSGTVHLPLQDMAPRSLTQMLMPTNCVPLVVQTCLTCGNTVFINMVVAGLCEGVE